MQLELFSETEIMSEKEIKKKKAKEYTVNSIFRSSGQRGIIKKYLELNEVEKAYKEFDKAFRTYGFGHGDYSFHAIFGKGKITVDRNFSFPVTSKELFQILLNITGY